MESFNNENINFGDSIGKWKLIKKIAKSGFNDIYLASFENSESIIKIPRSEEYWDKIDTEIECLNYLSNKYKYFPHILDSYSPNDAVPWLAIEKISGKNLKEIVKNKGPFNVIDWFKFAKELMNALAILEEKGITHEDIKPTNIFYNDGELKIIDFGLARIPNSVSKKLYEDSSIIDSWAGTFEYSSPEHFSGEHVSVMDVFSAASSLVYAGTGQSPFFASNSSEWMSTIGRDAPNFHSLAIPQKKFLNPLFPKNKTDRQSAKVCADFLNKLNNRDVLKDDSLFKTWPEFNNLTGTNFENEQVYQKLFKNRLQIKLINSSKNLIKLLANTSLVLIMFFAYIQPINNILQNLPPKSWAEKNAEKKLSEITSCLKDSFQLDVSNRFGKIQEVNEKITLDTEKVKSTCEKVADSGEAFGYIGLANLNNDLLEQEKNLLIAAKINPDYGFDSLLSFYSELANFNFEIIGKPSLETCTIQKNLFCLRVMGNMYYRIGLSDLNLKYKNDFKNEQMLLNNEDTFKGINYLREAANLGDVESAIDLALILRGQGRPIEYLELIKDSANKKNLAAMRWMYGYSIENSDEKTIKLWADNLKKFQDGNFKSQEILLEFYAENYDNAFNLAKDCLNTLYPLCYGMYSMILDGKADKLNEEVESYRLLAAIMGDSTSIIRVANSLVEQGKDKEAEWWFNKGKTYNEINGYIGLGDLKLNQNDKLGACTNYRIAAVILNRTINKSKDNYLKSQLDKINPSFDNSLDEVEDINIFDFRNTVEKINKNCVNNLG